MLTLYDRGMFDLSQQKECYEVGKLQVFKISINYKYTNKILIITLQIDIIQLRNRNNNDLYELMVIVKKNEDNINMKSSGSTFL
jgi:hypothetical protein